MGQASRRKGCRQQEAAPAVRVDRNARHGGNEDVGFSGSSSDPAADPDLADLLLEQNRWAMSALSKAQDAIVNELEMGEQIRCIAGSDFESYGVNFSAPEGVAIVTDRRVFLCRSARVLGSVPLSEFVGCGGGWEAGKGKFAAGAMAKKTQGITVYSRDENVCLRFLRSLGFTSPDRTGMGPPPPGSLLTSRSTAGRLGGCAGCW